MVLAPIVVEVGRDLDASVSAVGQARSVLSGVAVVCSLLIGGFIDRVGVRPVLVAGGALALLGAGLSAAAPSIAVFYAAQVPVGLGVACMLSAGFAGVPSFFSDDELTWAMGWVVAAQSVSWIVGNPLVGFLTDAVSWRLAYAVPAAFALLALLGGLTVPRRAAVHLPERSGIKAVLGEPSARRWAISELIAYSAWTAELTYVGAFYIQSYGIEESQVGLLLAGGSFAFLGSTQVAARLSERAGRRQLTMFASVGMGLMLVPVLNLTPSVAFTFASFCLLALFAGLRTTSSSALGLSQLPAQPGSMAAARTTAAQTGYAVGALLGGVVLAGWGFGALGFVLLGGMLVAALLLRGVRDPGPQPSVRGRLVPD